MNNNNFLTEGLIFPHMYRFNFIIILFTLFFFSCNKEILIDECVPESSSRSATHEEEMISSYLTLNISNDANNVTLEIDSFDFENIEVISYPTFSSSCLSYQDELTVTDIELIPQYLKQDSSYILIYGRVYCPTYTIYDGVIYVPLKGTIKPGLNVLKLSLYDGGPWFYYYGENLVKLLQSIQFDVTVDEWGDYEEIENV